MAGSEMPSQSLDYDDYIRLIRQVDELVVTFDTHPDEATRERVLALLTAVDLLHRTALTRLVEGLRDQGAGPALDGVCRDRVVETLLGLYDLADLDVPDDESLPDAPSAVDPTGHPADDPAVVAFVPRERLTMGPAGRKDE